MASQPPSVVLPCTRCWIEVELLDEDDKGVAREPYWIKLPDGQIREGRLDENGFVRLDGIPCGTCLVRFPRTTAPAIRREASPAEDKHFIEISLLGDDGAPVKGERYRVTLPDGSVRTGELDARGKARLDGIPAGVCQVTFPDLDRSEYSKVK